MPIPINPCRSRTKLSTVRFRRFGTALLLAAVSLVGLPSHHAGADPSGASAKKYRFVVYGDVRSHPEDHMKIVADILKVHPEFILTTGDYVEDGNNEAQWQEYLQIVKPFDDAHIPVFMAQGNHDVGLYIDHSTKLTDSTGAGNYYAFTSHQSRFIVIDSFDPDGFEPGSPQYAWLESELATAHKTAINTFVTFHVGPYSVGAHGPNLEVQTCIVPLFAKYHVRAVFNGHDHNYYRTMRAGVLYIVSGGGGAPLYDPDNAQSAIPGDVYATVHNFVVCDVDGSKVKCTAIAADHDSSSSSPWFIGNAATNDVVTVVKQDGAHSTSIEPGPGGAVIDTVTVNKPAIHVAAHSPVKRG